MKKLIALLLTLILTLSFTACGNKESSKTNRDTDDKSEASLKFVQLVDRYALDENGDIWDLSVYKEPVLLTEGDFESIFGGNNLYGAIATDGTLWTWGANASGGVGDGTTENRSAPVKILDHVKMASVNSYNGFAILEDGTLYQWGYGNNYKKLRADGNDKSNILTPTAVSTDVKFAYIASGIDSCVAIDTDGNRYVWGGSCTTLGCTANQIDSSMSSDAQLVPYTLMAIKNDTAPNGTYYLHGSTTYLIDSNNTLYISGGKDSRLEPYATDGSFGKFTKAIDGVTKIVPSTYGTLYVDVDGNIWGWGAEAFKLCESTTPVQITDGIKFVDVSLYTQVNQTAFAISSDGSLYVFGEDNNNTPELIEVE